MRLPDRAHTSQPWRIHALAPDFRLLDVWALPTPGGAGDFPALVELMANIDPVRSSSPVVQSLFAIRLILGRLLGWDSPSAGLGQRVPSLRDRLPADLRETGEEAEPIALEFKPVYRVDDEMAIEIANRTVHGILHLGWVQEGPGHYRGQMAVLVKPAGRLGTVYLAAIDPFRHLIVYPQLMREIGRGWRARRVVPVMT